MINYKVSPTGLKFHNSDAFFKMVLGPYGSGKSTMAAMDVLYNAAAQPAVGGVRYSSVGVLRSTYPELKSTTRKTLMEVLPDKQYGTINLANPMEGIYRIPLADGTTIQLELTLLALRDEMAAATKLKSANWSFAWVNEADTVPYEVIQQLTGRVGRFPPADLGGCRWPGIIMDFNRPAEGHFLLQLMQNPVMEVDGYTFTGEAFTQPPAAFRIEDADGQVHYEVNEDAENLENLHGGASYYARQIGLWLQSGNRNRVDALFCLLEAPNQAGKQVFGMFDTKLHVARAPIEVQPFHPVVVGYDTSGIHPAMVFLQEQQGKWCVLDELYGENVGLESFIEQAALPLINSKYANCSIVISCDPANPRDSYTGLTPSAHLQARGLNTFVGRVNDIKTRIRAVESLLNKNVGGLLVSPSCVFTLRALTSGYRYRKMRIMGSFETTYDTKPEKNEDSHLADALQYAALCILRQETEAGQAFTPSELAARTEVRRLRRMVMA